MDVQKRTALLAALVVALTLGMMALKVRITPWGSANTKSRYATIQCLVEEQTFAIDCSPYKATMDRVRLDGALYSSKPPLLSFAATSVYATLSPLGFTLKDDEHVVVVTTNALFAVVPHAIFLLFFFRLLTLLGLSSLSVVLAMCAAGPGFLATGYATDLNNHSPAATLVVIALFYAWRAYQTHARGEHAETGDFVKAGLAAGVLPAIDLPSGAISAAVLVLLFVVDKRRAVFVFLPATLPGVLAHLALTYVSTGSIVPVYMRDDAYEYATEPRRRPGFFEYTMNMLIGTHGIFSMTPALFLGALAVVDTLRRDAARRVLAIGAVAVSFVLFVFYVVETHNYGGTCVGFRWAIAPAPVGLVFFALFVERARPQLLAGDARGRALAAVVVSAIAVGAVHTQNALDNPWQDSKWQRVLVGEPPPKQKKPRAPRTPAPAPRVVAPTPPPPVVDEASPAPSAP